MTEIYETGDSVMGERLVVEARDIRPKRKPIMLYGGHRGQQAIAEGSARCYISKPISRIGKVTKT